MLEAALFRAGKPDDLLDFRRAAFLAAPPADRPAAAAALLNDLFARPATEALAEEAFRLVNELPDPADRDRALTRPAALQLLADWYAAGRVAEEPARATPLRLDDKAKVVRRGRKPLGHGLRSWLSVERVVELDRIEPRAVVPKEIAAPECGRVEAR